MEPVHLPDKKPGDTLEAKHVNVLNEAARLSFGRGWHGTVGGSSRGANTGIWWNPLEQMEVMADRGYSKGEDEKGLYDVRPRYYNRTSTEWRTRTTNNFLMDARDSGAEFAVGDVVTCYWHKQRSAWIPTSLDGADQTGETEDAGESVAYSFCGPFLDASTPSHNVDQIAPDGAWADFALEQSDAGDDSWHVVSDRKYSCNTSVTALEGSNAYVSAAGFYSIPMRNTRYFRLTAASHMQGVSLDKAAIRVHAVCKESVPDSLVYAISPHGKLAEGATVVHNWTPTVARGLNVPGKPSFELQANKLKVTCPAGQAWVIYITTSCRFAVGSSGMAKKSIRFSTSQAFNDINAELDGFIVEQFGAGSEAAEIEVVLVNPETATGNVHQYSGAHYAKGTALHMSGNRYLIIDLECP